jgi:hypothetical protein
VTKSEAQALSDRWHDLSTICFCRDGHLCSACCEQDNINERATANGWNIFTMKPVARTAL